ncbi:hypothetical protein [Gordonia soli]|uniref:Mce-associated membrane protein n=1 Tax=Gordonia soli NBRC 108243 TaxID=1223545 RepID=M0QNL5_9ACTN|nr:hypothetical protein [Gordonia soli]GAC69999.1 hypothetical protein GS4_30_00710 [Gordonia soli NBRC 108243]
MSERDSTPDETTPDDEFETVPADGADLDPTADDDTRDGSSGDGSSGDDDAVADSAGVSGTGTTEATAKRPTSKASRSAAQRSATRASSAAAAEDEPDSEPPTPDPKSASGRQISFTVSGRGVLKAIAALAVVALVVAVVLLALQARQQSQRLDAFTDSKAASEEFVTKLVSTLNAENADNYKELLGPLSTGKLRERLEQDRQATQQNVESLKLQATSSIKLSSVESFGTDSAKTLVMAEVSGRSATAPNGTSNLMVFRLDLSKEDGRWLVSNVDGPPGSANGQIDPSQSLPGGGGALPGATGGAPAPATPTPAPQPAPAG